MDESDQNQNDIPIDQNNANNEDIYASISQLPQLTGAQFEEGGLYYVKPLPPIESHALYIYDPKLIESTIKNHIEYIPGTTLENPLTYLYKFPYFPTFESKQEVFSEAIENNKMIDVVLLTLYIEHIEKNLKELEEEENEYKEFIKQLGADKEGYDNYDYEKLFRPRDTSNDIKDNEDNDNEVSLDKLISIGAVEEFDDNLKEF